MSDNGRNFVGAESELRDALEAIDRGQVVICTATKQHTSWTFNPPRAPHHGGFFEALVRSAKRAVFAILHSANFTDEELQTAFVQAETLLISRPLTTVGSDADDLVPLTPQQFLIGHIQVERP